MNEDQTIRRPIPVAGPWITEREVRYAADAAATAWYAEAGSYPARFEAAFAAYVGRRHAVALPSCTSGLHLALAALGIGPGDEVVVPDVTWIASAAPIAYVGATPVFADIDADSWCLDAAAFEAVITPRTRAVIVVDLYGNMPDWGAIADIAAAHDIAVIEDAAEAVGSSWQGRLAGGFGLASAFSFHGSKTLTTGEGGMLVTDDDAFHDRVLFLRDHGRVPGDRTFRSTEVAFKYRMSALQAALGLAQTERVDALVARKRAIFAAYREALADVPGVILNAEAPGVVNSAWMVTALAPESGLAKDEIIAALAAAGVDSRPMFDPLSAIPAFAETPQGEAARARNRVAYAVTPSGVNLPSALTLNAAEIAAAADAYRHIITRG